MIWEGFFFFREESTDVSRWIGIIREDSILWKGLYFILEKLDFYLMGN